MGRREFSHLEPVERLAAQIIERLNYLSSRKTKRELERSMSAHKRPYWPEAWELLLERECIKLTPGKRRQQIVTLTDLPAWAEPKPIVKKRRRKRPQSDWFKFLLPVFLDRDGYEEKAAKASAALEQDWRQQLDEMWRRKL
jgi:hypothetical protein